MGIESKIQPPSLIGDEAMEPPLLVFGGYTVRVIAGESSLMEAYRLRYAVFSSELGWSKGTKEGLDIDRYDRAAVPMGLYDSDNVLTAYLRIITRPGSFMIEDEFSALAGKQHAIRDEADTVEASRFCMTSKARNRKVVAGGVVRNISILLVKGLYLWCRRRGVRYIYAVSEEKALRFFRSLGLPFTRMGGPVMMPDGVSSGAFLLDWRGFERLNTEAHPLLMEWFSVQLDQPGG